MTGNVEIRACRLHSDISCTVQQPPLRKRTEATLGAKAQWSSQHLCGCMTRTSQDDLCNLLT